MARLILTYEKQVLKEIPFQEGSITIGRRNDNTIVIDNLAVSAYHARIDKAGKSYIITDLQSTNGTFVNDKKIVSLKLSHGDNIVIGKHMILFVEAAREEAPDEGVSKKLNLDETMMLDTARQRDLLSKQAGAEQQPTTSMKKVAVVSFIDSSGLGEIELTKKLTRIGKSATSEIKLSGLLMGGTAATISRRPSNYTITFAGGLTKLKVNGEVIKTSVPLKDFDTIELGGYRFQFYQKEVDEL
jgi:pSer/pThr/pTyr-binding forkhead associated (FHA) protein